MRPEYPPPRIPTGRLIAGLLGLLLICIAALSLLSPGFLLGAGPIATWLHLEGSSYDRYAGGGWYAGCSPSFFHDGKTIVYSSPRSGRGDIYSVAISDLKTARLTHSPEYEAEPSFSPDGKQVVYVRQMHDVLNSYKSRLWIMSSDGSHQRQLTFGDTEYYGPVFDPSGKSVLCYSDFGVCRLDLATGVVTKVAAGVYKPVISADGKHIYGYQPITDHDPQIVSMNPDGGDCICLGTGYDPDVSPNGKLIVFLDEPGNQPLWIMKSDGSSRRQIPTPVHTFIAHPTFSPDGKHIVFLDSSHRGVGSIDEIGLDGSGLKRITSTQ